MTAQDRAERRSAHDEWMTAEQMAALCGVSVATVKRRAEDGRPIKCRDGTLVEIESEKVARPQGWEWRVRAMTALPALMTEPEAAALPIRTSLTSGAQSDQRALDILETLLRANGETFERQAEKITHLTGEAWEARALARIAEVRLEAAQEALRTAQQERDTARADATSAWNSLATTSTVSHELSGRLAAAEAERDALAADLARQAGRRWYDPRTW